MTAADTLRWRQLDARHHLHPFTDHAELAARGSRIITRAEGCWLWDSEGNRLLDGMAGLWCVNVGYGRAELVEAARRQMATLSYYNTFFQSSTPAAIELAARLAELAPGLDRVFFTNSGSEANDTAIKLVRWFWNLQGRPTKKIMISRTYGYHGVTLATASLSGLPAMHAQADLPLPGFEHVEAPYWYAHGGDLTPEAHGQQAARRLEERILELGPDNVAAFIGEPVQGAGGVIVPPRGLLAGDRAHLPPVRRAADRRRGDLRLRPHRPLVGLRAVRLHARHHHRRQGPRRPATCRSPRCWSAAGSATPWSRPAASGRTASPSPAIRWPRRWRSRTCGSSRRRGCTSARAARSAPISPTRWPALADHPLVGEVRTCGLLAAIELVEDPAARRHFPPERAVGAICREHCIAEGLVMRAVRDVMVLAPPLIISEAEIDQIVLRAGRALERTAADLGRPGGR